MVGGLGARAHTLLPTVRSSGQPVNAREAWPFCPCSGEVFRGLGVAAQSGRPERARPCAHYDATAAGRAEEGGVKGGLSGAAEPCGWQGSVDSPTEWCHSLEGCRTEEKSMQTGRHKKNTKALIIAG